MRQVIRMFLKRGQTQLTQQVKNIVKKLSFKASLMKSAFKHCRD